jgi:hypothetical protein
MPSDQNQENQDPFRNITRNRNVISISRPLPEFGRSRFLKSIQPRAARTFDDAQLTVSGQNPATFGQDRYLLTNYPGLPMLNSGLIAEVRIRSHGSSGFPPAARR